MRKDICICDVCKKQIPDNKDLEFEMFLSSDVAKELGLKSYAHRIKRRHRLRRKCYLASLDVCSKECFIKLLEVIKNG